MQMWNSYAVNKENWKGEYITFEMFLIQFP